jgi:hypothetical protein
VVALGTAARTDATPRAHARHGTSRWLSAAAAVLLVGAFGPLAVASGPGHLSASVLSLLLGLGAAAVGLALGSARLAFFLVLAAVVLLDLGRLPPRPGAGFEEPEALWRTDQAITAAVSVPASAEPRLFVLVEPVLSSAQAPFGMAATLDGRPLAWHCPFQPGLQWLVLPLEPGLLGQDRTVDVRLGLAGAPDRERNYLVVFRSAAHGGYLVGLAADPSVQAPVTTCLAT